MQSNRNINVLRGGRLAVYSNIIIDRSLSLHAIRATSLTPKGMETRFMTTIIDTKEQPIVLKVTVQRSTRMRYVMLSFPASCYDRELRRQNQSWNCSAVHEQRSEFSDKAQMGQIFAAFGLTYAFALIPGGYIADVFGSRLSYAIALVSWSAATMVQGFTNSFNTLVGTRLAIGALEAPAFPANARAVTMWFPTNERGFATRRLHHGPIPGDAAVRRDTVVGRTGIRMAIRLLRHGTIWFGTRVALVLHLSRSNGL